MALERKTPASTVTDTTLVAAIKSPDSGATSSPTFTDQARSHLMSVSAEIRNRIFEYVFCDNVERVRELVKNRAARSAAIQIDCVDVPAEIRLDSAAPPSKDSIMTCRQLYYEMREMYAAAYRGYWKENRFSYDVSMLRPSVLPADKDMEHIRHFIMLDGNGGSVCLMRGNIAWFIRYPRPDEELNNPRFNNARPFEFFHACKVWDPRMSCGLTRQKLREYADRLRPLQG